ncbi:putative disease resistance protein [Morus notabilis]|uniref:Putative disease resistance protein n=2 Tax=Morus notabilis TaxID=981085 RepID=W9SFH2_9ROSA|nr:putative disease resistance protein [Morus notabilis]
MDVLEIVVAMVVGVQKRRVQVLLCLQVLQPSRGNASAPRQFGITSTQLKRSTMKKKKKMTQIEVETGSSSTGGSCGGGFNELMAYLSESLVVDGTRESFDLVQWWRARAFTYFDQKAPTRAMDCVSPILDVGIRLWDCSAKRISYVHHLEENVASLSNAMNELKNISQDVKRRVDFAVEQDFQCTNQVKGWLESVEAMEGVNQILQKGNEEIQNKCLGSCPKNYWSRYALGKGVAKKLDAKRINNEFVLLVNDFDVVIWVVASKEASISKIQDAIQDRLQIPDDEWKSNRVEERSIKIYRTLRGKKFVLLLDDVWKQFDLLKVGVPIPDIHNGSKVIFTTRSKEVCGQMEADKCIRVECLEQEKALDLFLEKVGEEALSSHPTIPHLAKAVAKECKGLPLALITVGRSMASRKCWDICPQIK